MDCRLTIKNNETFLEILVEAQQSNKQVNLMLDDGGLERKQGYIKNIIKENSKSLVILDNGESIAIEKIIAVNGIFKGEYGEC